MMITTQKAEEKYTVYRQGALLGTVTLYENPCHRQNRYLKLEMDQLTPDIAPELFCQLHKIAGRPLQVMVNSTDTALTDFLLAGGFQCKRRCYEVEAEAGDFSGGRSDTPLSRCAPGSAAYQTACRMLFDHYTQTHQAINPWTADLATFCENLPQTVVYAEKDGQMQSLAFVEDGEIAYICGREKRPFTAFASALVADLFTRYETICFESDDCDWAAMALKEMFANQSEASFDTYVYAANDGPKVEIRFGEMETALRVMQEVAAWGRQQGYRVWPAEWLTAEALRSPYVQLENFCVGLVDGEIACAFLLQWEDPENWPAAPHGQAAYLHKFCVRRKYAGRGMTKLVTQAIQVECRRRGLRYIRLDTALDEKTVRKIYLDAGYKIVDILDGPGGRSLALYEQQVD